MIVVGTEIDIEPKVHSIDASPNASVFIRGSIIDLLQSLEKQGEIKILTEKPSKH